MPIRPENRARYPKDWPQIRARILRRASRNSAQWPWCEECGVANHDIGWRDRDGHWISTPWLKVGEREEHNGSAYKIVMIVLTIAHLDHTPENCANENLKALCQRCHNRYDMPMRRAGIKARAKIGKAIGDLFACSEVQS